MKDPATIQGIRLAFKSLPSDMQAKVLHQLIEEHAYRLGLEGKYPPDYGMRVAEAVLKAWNEGVRDQ